MEVPEMQSLALRVRNARVQAYKYYIANSSRAPRSTKEIKLGVYVNAMLRFCDRGV